MRLDHLLSKEYLSTVEWSSDYPVRDTSSWCTGVVRRFPLRVVAGIRSLLLKRGNDVHRLLFRFEGVPSDAAVLSRLVPHASHAHLENCRASTSILFVLFLKRS